MADLLPHETKRCSKCGQTQVVGENFYRSKSQGSRGWGGYCKKCSRASATAWDAEHVEERRGRDRRSHRKRKVKIAAYKRQWWDALPAAAKEKRIARLVAWNKAHPEQTAARVRRWAAENPEKRKVSDKRARQQPKAKERHKLSMRRRRALMSYQVWDNARRAGVPTSGPPITLEEWREILAVFEFSCAYCGKRPEKLEMEHLTPVCRGGEHVRGNVAPACRSCNARKRHRTLEEYCRAAGLDPQGIREKLLWSTGIRRDL